jgi:excisionase family DNA binding protein
MNPLSTYTPAEVSKMLGVKQSTVYAWISRKELSASKVGRNRFITQRQINEFLEIRENGDCIDRTYPNC